MEIAPVIPVTALGALALAAMWTDLGKRMLPNWLVGLTLAGGLLFAFLSGGTDGLLNHLAHFAIALVIGFGFFGLKFWGGGDGKFYAAVAAWFALSDFFLLLFTISAIGLALVIVMVVRNGGKIRGAASVPYGVAIGLGGAITLARHLL